MDERRNAIPAERESAGMRQMRTRRSSNSRFAFVVLFSLMASGCPFGDEGGDPVAQNPPPPPAPPAPPPPAADCWNGLADIDEVVGCHEMSFDASPGDFEIYEAVMTYPEQFAFNGFTATGPPGTPVGTMSLDFGADDAADHTVVFRSLGDSAAYADVLRDGAFSPGLEPVFGHLNGTTFLLRLPFGGDGDPQTLAVPIGMRVLLRLREEIVTSDTLMGTSFSVSGELTTVDPETDGLDDGQGGAPSVTPFTADVTILE